jgi:hypothetical protein
MSRYSLKPLPQHSDIFEVAVGWDAGFGTYFAIVFAGPESNGELTITARRGARPNDLRNIAALEVTISEFADLPLDVTMRLDADKCLRRKAIGTCLGKIIDTFLRHKQ